MSKFQRALEKLEHEFIEFEIKWLRVFIEFTPAHKPVKRDVVGTPK